MVYSRTLANKPLTREGSRVTLVNMNRKQIIGAIMAATGKSVPEVAEKHNYTKQAFYDVIKKRTKTPHLRDLIASIIDKPVSEVWPEKEKEVN